MRVVPWRFVLASLAGVATLCHVGPAPAAALDDATGRPVVLVLVPGLTWDGAPAALDGYAKANLSVRTARARTAPADGYLSVGKGAPSSAPLDLGAGRVEPAPGGGLHVLDWERLQRHDRGLHYAGELGRLGRILDGSGLAWALVAIDPATPAVAADAGGVARTAVTGGPDEVSRALAAGAGAVVVGAPPAELPAVIAAAGPACVIVASVSTPEESRHLGVLAASPACGLGTGGLASPSTHHDHLATLMDVTPSFLSRLGVSRPDGLSGSVVRDAPAVSRPALVERDERAYAVDQNRSALVWLFVGLSAIGAAVALARPRARVPVAYALLAIPPASFGVSFFPWWRWGFAGAVLTGALLCLGLAAGAAVAGRGDVRFGVGGLAAATAAAVGIDALFGGWLEIDAPFGNSPVVGARFFGVGNVGSGFLAAGLLVAGGVALDRWGRRALPAVAAGMAIGVVAGGAPWFGADAGGVLAFTPAYLVLLLGWRRGRPDARRLLLALAAAAVALALFALIDIVRPGPDQSHLGRAVSGEGTLDQALRKADRALNTIKSPMALLIPIGAVALAFARPRLAGRPALRAAAWALLTAGVAGSVLNDSGLVVGAAVMAVAWPSFLVLGGPEPEAPRETAPTREMAAT